MVQSFRAPDFVSPMPPVDQQLVSEQSLCWASVPEILAELQAGRAIVLINGDAAKATGDLLCAADFVTPDLINFFTTQARGLISVAMTAERLQQLRIPLMVKSPSLGQQAFTVSVDAAWHKGGSTGISAGDRCLTIQLLTDPTTQPNDLTRPGHVFPIQAQSGGVFSYAGRAEATVDLLQLAGLYPAGVLCEIHNADGSTARYQDLLNYANAAHLKCISVADLLAYRLQHENWIQQEAIANFPSQFGDFKIYGYHNLIDASEAVAIVKGDPAEFAHQPVLVRIHSECLTGDALGSLRCDCRSQLELSLQKIEAAGKGVIVYLRQEGRGIGLLNKIKAYALQDVGLDTVEANHRLGFPSDSRNYAIAAQILKKLAIQQVRLLTGNPQKAIALKRYGMEVVEQMPLNIQPNPHNAHYLATKVAKMGHLLYPPSLSTKLVV